MRKPGLSLAAGLLAAVLTLAGCTRLPEQAAEQPAPPVSAANPGTEKPVTEVPAASPDRRPESAALFPATDWEYTFDIWDAGAAKAGRPVEQWLLEGDRLLMLSDGKPYATWLFDESGVWRLDPKGGGVLLRYLPPTLHDGETWRQKSGEADVWFSLNRGADECLVALARSADRKSCWTLTVLNRGELSTFEFVSNFGPTVVKAVNYAKPASSFFKLVRANQAGQFTAAERKALVDRTSVPSAPKATVIETTAAEFGDALQNLPGVSTATADLDGDGKEETLRGPVGVWTTADVQILDQHGNLLEVFRAYRGREQRVSLVRFQQANHAFALVEQRGGGVDPKMGMALLSHHKDSGWGLGYSWGWDAKSTGTGSSRVTVAEDGMVIVEWDLGDPARHTRVRQYRFDPVRFQATQESESFRAEGAELVYPEDPLDVLQAAFVTRWFGLSDELPRYFASPEAAAGFHTHKGISKAQYRPGEVRFAAVTAKKEMCDLETSPAALGPDGTVPFTASWGGYEWWANAWGKVTFGKDAQGRLVIAELKVEGTCEGGL